MFVFGVMGFCRFGGFFNQTWLEVVMRYHDSTHQSKHVIELYHINITWTQFVIKNDSAYD